MRIEVGESAQQLTVADGAPEAICAAAIRGALVAQRERLAILQIDVVSDDEWPDDMRPVVDAAERRLQASRSRHITLDLNPHADEEFALAPFTICGTGISRDGRLIWSADDTGTSTCFELTPFEEAEVRAAIVAAGGAAEDLVNMAAHTLSRRRLTYSPVGGTAPDTEEWDPPAGYRRQEHTVRLGEGDEFWAAATAAVLSWGVKTRSGFRVDPLSPPGRAVEAGERFWLVARVGPVRVREPVEIVAVVTTEDRVGVAYGTLDGHPVAGEEAFIVHRDDVGAVSLTVRSLTRPGAGRWRPLYPAILVAQQVYRRRYLRALRGA